jgi:hypothetical protein
MERLAVIKLAERRNLTLVAAAAPVPSLLVRLWSFS